MIDDDGDGFGDTAIGLALSDGRPDKFVESNLFDGSLNISLPLMI